MSDCGDVKKVFVATAPAPTGVDKPISGIQISDKAAEKITLFLQNEGKSVADFGLRVAVKKDGCSGMSYDMALSDLETSKAQGDKIFEHNGAHVMIEKTSYFYVIGSVMDYVEALTGSGFTLTNPNIKKTCSCGSSFSV
ncbi:MAG: HesB/IscA family protein [Candidatus Margulisiibacteriota bacterium]